MLEQDIENVGRDESASTCCDVRMRGWVAGVGQ